MDTNRGKGKRHVILTNSLRCSGIISTKLEQPEKIATSKNVKEGKINKLCPQIARSSGRDHHCVVALADICFAAWLCTVVCAEKAVCVYHLWHRSMGFGQFAAGKVV